MTISSTYFPRKNIYKATWKSPDGTTCNQIDHVLIDKRHGSDIFNVRTCRGADIDSDHYLVKVSYRQRLSRLRTTRNPRNHTYDSEKLIEDDSLRETYRERVNTYLNESTIIPGSDTIEEEWEIIKTSIKRAAEESLGFKKPPKRSSWFDAECQAAIEERNEARKKNIQRVTRGTMQAFTQARTKASHICRKKKGSGELQKSKKSKTWPELETSEKCTVK